MAILFTDLVGFSSWALEAGDQLTVELLREFSAAVEPPIVERRGEVVKRLGDGLMGAFWDAPSAAEAAFAAVERAAGIEVGGYTPRLRTGIHLGRPRKLGGDYFGVDVNIAARLSQWPPSPARSSSPARPWRPSTRRRSGPRSGASAPRAPRPTWRRT